MTDVSKLEKIKHDSWVSERVIKITRFPGEHVSRMRHGILYYAHININCTVTILCERVVFCVICFVDTPLQTRFNKILIEPYYYTAGMGQTKHSRYLRIMTAVLLSRRLPRFGPGVVIRVGIRFVSSVIGISLRFCYSPRKQSTASYYTTAFTKTILFTPPTSVIIAFRAYRPAPLPLPLIIYHGYYTWLRTADDT